MAQKATLFLTLLTLSTLMAVYLNGQTVTSHHALKKAPVPSIHLSDVYVSEEKIEPTRLQALDYNQNRIRFSYKPRNIEASQPLRYRYRLEGLESQWYETRQSSVLYAYLPPGAYRFAVKAVDTHGAPLTAAAEIGFRVRAPYPHTWWFRLALAVVFLCLLTALYAGSRRGLKKKFEAEFNQKSQQAETVKLLMAQRMELTAALAHSVAQDLKTLLGIISGYSDRTVKKYPSGDANLKNMERIADTAGTALQMVNQIFAFAQRKKDVKETVDIVRLVDTVIETLKVSIPPFIQLNWRPPKEFISCKIHPTHFQQMVMNLCLNSVQAMPRGGKLDVKLGKHQDIFLLEIKDTGCGIKQDDLPRIFDPLFTTKKQEDQSGDSGLGLFAVKQIVDQYKGNIEVQSKLGRGSIFKLTFDTSRDELS